MDALAKKRLKTLQLTDWASFIEDVNYNFSVLLSSPLFVGLQGEDGVQGASGPAGARGSKWMFVDVDVMRTSFPDDIIEGAYNITASYLTTKLQTASTRNELLKALNAGSMFVDGDIIVSNSKLLLVDLANNRIVDTGEAINANQDVFIETMQRQIRSLVDEYLKTNTDLDNVRQIVTAQGAIAKNYPDSSALGLNTTYDARSIFDITTETSGPGYVTESHKMFYPAPSVVNPDDGIMWIFGSRERYHEIVQQTLAYSSENLADNSTSDYGPNSQNMPAVVVLQNDDKSGIIIGKKTAKKFTEFGRIFIDAEGRMVFVSPYNHAKHTASKFILGDEMVQLVTELFKIKGNFEIDGNFKIGGHISTEGLVVNSDGSVTAGIEGKPFTIIGSSLQIPGFSVGDSSTFLTVKNGVIQKSSAEVFSDVPGFAFVAADSNQKKLATVEIINWLVDILIRGVDEKYLDNTESIIAKVLGEVKALYDKVNTTEKNTNENFNAINKTISGFASTLNGFNQKLTEQSNLMGNLATQVDAMPGKITSVKTEVVGALDIQKKEYTELINETKQLVAREKSELSQRIDTNDKDIEQLKKDVDLSKKPTYFPVPGMIYDLWVESTGSYDDIVNAMFTSTGVGRTVATYTVRGKEVTVDLSEYGICNGKNGFPDLRGVVLAGASTENAPQKKVGDTSITLKDSDVPAHTHSATGTLTSSEDSHTHSLAGISVSSSGEHSHDIAYNDDSKHVGNNAGGEVQFGGPTNRSNVVKSSGAHTHSLSGNISGGAHKHTVDVSGITIQNQHNKSQTSISVMQPTMYCLKMMYIGK